MNRYTAHHYMPFSCVESSQYLLYFMDNKMSKIKWDAIKHRSISEKFHSAQQDETPNKPKDVKCSIKQFNISVFIWMAAGA